MADDRTVARDRERPALSVEARFAIEWLRMFDPDLARRELAAERKR